MKNYFSIILAFSALIFLPVTNIYAQVIQEVPISDEGTVESTNCSEYIRITDSNADNGNYLPGESYQITACINTIEEPPVQVEILPTNPVTGSVWDVDANSSLFIYEGTGTTGNLLGEFNSVSDPNGVFFTTSSTCVTFVFISGTESSGAGFLAAVKCIQELQPFDLDLSVQDPHEFSDEEFDGLEGKNVITICYTDSIALDAIVDFPLSDATGNGYEQTIDSTKFVWDWGDGTTDEGMGLISNGHIFIPYGGFLVRVTAEDEMGQIEKFEFFVLVAPRPVFSGILFNDTLCAGDTTNLTGGILGADTVGIGPSTGFVNLNYDFTGSLYLPDGSGENYNQSINIFGYEGDPVIEDSSDFANICLNMEHSYLGDLEAWLTCPDGSTALLFDGYSTGPGGYGGVGFGGSNTFLGDANDDGTQEEGIGFDYCFADDGPLGTMEEEFNAGNTVPVTTFGTGGNAMVEGSYQPAESFSNFVGCPLNGEWTLTIRDNIGIDNGYIFNWSIQFAPQFVIDSIFYTPPIADAYWLDNPDIVVNNDTIVTVVPSSPGPNSFTFRAEDDFGCIHDTTFTVYVRPFTEFPDAIACDLTHIAAPTNAPNGGEYTTLTTPGSSASLEYIPFSEGISPDSIVANEFGVYTVDFTENNCGYSDTATIDFRPDPQIEAFLDSIELCVDESVTLDAGPQEDNSDNFSIIWTQNGNAFNTSDYAVTVDQTGVYQLNITGVCGIASDTTNIVAIELAFAGDTVCGLQAQGSAQLSPDGDVSWSADSPNISFGTINQLSTSIVSTQYGSYPISITDSRCPEDVITHDFTFVEQPDVSIDPQYPDFCVDSDSLVLVASVNGSNSGTYIWSINGTSEVGQQNKLEFGPRHFEPLEDYLIEVLVQDAFGVCPMGTGMANFTGEWCEYNIPNVVTPNDDGMNDRFHVQYINYFPGTHLRIFDRWGKMVFDQANYDQYQEDYNGWDPTDEKAGTYFYELLIPQADKKETGYIQVLKDDSEQ